MTNPKCYLCGSDDKVFLPGEVRDIKHLKIFRCNSCNLVYLSDFSHIDDSFYRTSKMHENPSQEQLQGWGEQAARDDQRRFDFLIDQLSGRSVLDFGCGCGGFLLKAKG